MEYTDNELQQERWKPIFGYDGLYEVSDLGRVRSRKSGEWKVLKAMKNSCGYLVVNLCKDGDAKCLLIHRLVADAFIPNDDDSKIYINHIDENRGNPKASNLEWCTAQYNITYNDINRRKKYRQNVKDKIAKLYNPDLTIRQNLELFKANGIECSKHTVWKLRKDLGLIGQGEKRTKIKSLYRQDLTISDNISLLKEYGIECSRKTLQRLRKDLGLS